MKHWTLVALAVTALAGAPALAHERMHGRHDDDRGDRGDLRRSTIEMLKERDQRLQHKAMVMRIGPVAQRDIAEQRDRIGDLIDDLEDGKNVSRHELDEALGHSYHRDYPRHHHHPFEG